jgi:WD40 repeat protein/predicted Ser/Thr protein kinase
MCARCLLAAALCQPATAAPAGLPEPGEWIGSCRVVRLLGEGGMGMVYLAEQEQPIARQVALKIIKLGMDTRAVLARFESEEQALALMDHPNIAHVYEAGSSANGRPYFVMEYVPGIPITEYCDRHRLDTGHRLALFLQVANAVQHAHQKGVIHRDLKPSNILVMQRDGEAVPKIIDFGLAKATEKSFTEETLFTEAGVLIGTPEYMSPEQASRDGRDVDTRTDIYSLGVLLYELLVGAVPFDSKALRSAGYDEIRRIIREEDPPVPTTRLLALGAKAAGIASCRATDAGRLRKEVRGDLEWITMKALEKECARRYPSASEMAADIQRHLRDEPVTAGPAGAAYRLRKFVSKNAPAVGAAVLIAVSLLTALVVSTAYFIRAERQYERAQRGSYTANLAAAELLLRNNQMDSAQERLLACEPKLRNWEWRHLWHTRDSSLARWHSQGEFTDYPFPSVIGFAGPRTCWNTQTTVECWEGPGYTAAPVFRAKNVLGMSHDGALAVTADDVVRLIEVVSGRTIATCLDCSQPGIYAVFSPDRTRVAMAAGRETVVWDARSGKILARLPLGRVLIFSPDGTQFALHLQGSQSNPDRLELWSVNPVHRVASLDSGGYVRAAAFSPDGARLAWAAAGGSVRVGSLRPVKVPTVLTTEEGVEAIAFSPDGHRIAATGDGAIRIWLDGKLAARVPAFGAPNVNAIAFSPGGTRIVAGSQFGELAAWDAATYGGQVLRRPADRVGAIAVSPDSARVAAGFENGLVEVWGTNGAVLGNWRAHGDEIQAVAFSPDGKRLATGSADRTARLWDATSGAPGIELRGHGAAVTAVAFSPDGARLATGSEDQSVRIWETASGRATITINLKDPVISVAFSPAGGSLLVNAGDMRRVPTNETPVRLWNATSGALLREFRTSKPCGSDSKAQCPVSQVSISPDGRHLVGAVLATRQTWVWDVRTGAVIAELPTVRSTGSAVFSPDGSRIVTGSRLQGVVQVWDAVGYQPLLTMQADDDIRLLAFSPDGSRLLAMCPDDVRMWDTATVHAPPERARGPCGPASAALIQPVPALRCESALIPVTFGVLFFTPTWKLMRQEALYEWE